MTNRFPEEISKEEITELPVGQFAGRIVVVDDESQAERACRELMSHPVVGFDTETRPTFKPGALNKVALLQLSTPDTCYLFRLCKMPLERAILRLLESDKVLKVGAGVAGDLRALQELRRFRPGGFVDLQGIVGEWGIADKSVRKMAAIITGVRISKAQRLSNWEAGELTPGQCMYAATDAWICLEMYRTLNATDRK